MQEAPSHYLVTPQQALSAARQAGLSDKQLTLSGLAVLTFNKFILDRLEQLCGLQAAQWISGRHHPYGAAEIIKRGQYQGLSVTVLVPPMGASPLACIVEDLVACGIEMIILACAAWSLGPPVKFGDMIVPAFSVGPDGTSVHYDNATGYMQADPAVVQVLEAACRARGATVHIGGNATCEALYRITPQMMNSFRDCGCLCMENGEASTLFAVTKALGIPSGAIFQPYIDLHEGWNPAMRFDETYHATQRIQAEVVLEAGLEAWQRGRT
jgi:uridine phosphorylase